jgi:hypothetical protein
MPITAVIVEDVVSLLSRINQRAHVLDDPSRRAHADMRS